MPSPYKFSAIEPRWLLILIFFSVGIFLGWFATYLGLNIQPGAIQKLRSKETYTYINPLLAADNPNGSSFARNRSLELELQNLITNNTKSGKISFAAVYFRDVDPGYFVGINEDSVFSPGKLLKIPIMMAYYRLAQTDPGILSEKITFSGQNSNLVSGGKYTVDDLLNRMILDNDEDVAKILFDNIDKPSLDEVFSDLGINFREDKVTQDFISVKQYAMLYRVLYNSTFLDRMYSEKALALIDKADDNTGLAARTPREVLTVTRASTRNIDQGYEMNDCGLTYYPKHTYLLCAFARGRKLGDMQSFLAEVGETSYREVNYEYGPGGSQ